MTNYTPNNIRKMPGIWEWLFIHQITSERCPAYKCDVLISQSKSIIDLPEPETKGIFAIKEGETVIYIGQSQDCIRERILSHLSGYDSQDIGEYLKVMNKEEKQKCISISWVKILRPRCDEHHYIRCIEKRQGKWPRYNRMRGRPKKTVSIYKWISMNMFSMCMILN